MSVFIIPVDSNKSEIAAISSLRCPKNLYVLASTSLDTNGLPPKRILVYCYQVLIL
jgi:hypothetical protein